MNWNEYLETRHTFDCERQPPHHWWECVDRSDCGKELRDGHCMLDIDHRGRHSTVVFYCDACGRMRRGYPQAVDEDVAMCFLCAMLSRRAVIGEY